MNIITTIIKSIIINIITTIVAVDAADIVYIAVFSNFIVYKLFLVFKLLLKSIFPWASL